MQREAAEAQFLMQVTIAETVDVFGFGLCNSDEIVRELLGLGLPLDQHSRYSDVIRYTE